MNYSYPVCLGMVEFRREEFGESHYEVGDRESLEYSGNPPVADVETCMKGLMGEGVRV